MIIVDHEVYELYEIGHDCVSAKQFRTFRALPPDPEPAVVGLQISSSPSPGARDLRGSPAESPGAQRRSHIARVSEGSSQEAEPWWDMLNYVERKVFDKFQDFEVMQLRHLATHGVTFILQCSDFGWPNVEQFSKQWEGVMCLQGRKTCPWWEIQTYPNIQEHLRGYLQAPVETKAPPEPRRAVVVPPPDELPKKVWPERKRCSRRCLSIEMHGLLYAVSMLFYTSLSIRYIKLYK